MAFFISTIPDYKIHTQIRSEERSSGTLRSVAVRHLAISSLQQLKDYRINSFSELRLYDEKFALDLLESTLCFELGKLENKMHCCKGKIRLDKAE